MRGLTIGFLTISLLALLAGCANRDAQLMGEYLTNDHASLTDLIKYVENWLPNNVEKDRSVFIYYSGYNEQTPQLLASPDLARKGGGRLVELTRP